METKILDLLDRYPFTPDDLMVQLDPDGDGERVTEVLTRMIKEGLIVDLPAGFWAVLMPKTKLQAPEIKRGQPYTLTAKGYFKLHPIFSIRR